jgi:hypothetical protein
MEIQFEGKGTAAPIHRKVYNKSFATLLHLIKMLSFAAMRFKINWDAIGIATSLACAIHCAVLPLILTSLPLFGINLVDNVGFEYFMIFLACCVGVYSLWHGFRKHHHSFFPIIVFLSGMILLIAKQVWHDYQLWLLAPAVILIVTAHIINFKACRVHNHAHAEDCDHEFSRFQKQIKPAKR